MGLGVILLSILPGYQPELISFLFGSVLAIGWVDVFVILSLTIIVIILMLYFRNSLIFASFDSEYAKVSGVNVDRIDTIYQVLLAVSIVAGIKLVGIILVNALLVIPASTVRLFAGSLKQMFIFTPILAVIITLFGLFSSYILNIPSGPTIAVSSGIVFLLGVTIKRSR